MREPITLFIVEGEKRDYRFAKEMERCFFVRGRHKITVISVPASQNVYMLYEQLREDDFDTDVVEILRERVPDARAKLEGVSRHSIDQIYLFFDFDPHQDNLTENGVASLDAIDTMLQVFDNETEHGKLFISYPMVEALYDYRRDCCQAFSGCFIPIDDVPDYKRMAGDGNDNASEHMEHNQWKEVIEVFALRVKCLLGLSSMSYELYRKKVTPLVLFQAQRKVYELRERVFVLSAFPEFLLDYFKRDFWNSHVKRTRYSFERCEKEEMGGAGN